MCGIVGYVGDGRSGAHRPRGLARLEYRGYDSAGIAVLDGEGDLSVTKDVGKLASPARQRSKARCPPGSTGIGHTRWATHGKRHAASTPTLTLDVHGDIVVIHNGIVENHRELRDELQSPRPHVPSPRPTPRSSPT